MKIEVKFSYTKTGPKAFIRPYTDEWEPTTTALRAYRKDMRNIKEATQFPEGEGYYAVMNPWLLESVLKANDIDAMQLVKAAQMENPPLENVRYANSLPSLLVLLYEPKSVLLFMLGKTDCRSG